MIGYTGGTFDIPHFGHYNFFRMCKDFCDYLVVSLNTDEFIKSYKGKAPEFSYSERLKILENCPYIDQIVCNFGNEDSTQAIDLINPDIILIGQDWLSKDYCKQMGFTPDWLTNRSISLIYLPYTLGISSTLIKERIK